MNTTHHRVVLDLSTRTEVCMEMRDGELKVIEIKGASEHFVQELRKKSEALGLAPRPTAISVELEDLAWYLLAVPFLSELAQRYLNTRFEEIYDRIHVDAYDPTLRRGTEIRFYLADENGDSGSSWVWKDNVLRPA